MYTPEPVYRSMRFVGFTKYVCRTFEILHDWSINFLRPARKKLRYGGFKTLFFLAEPKKTGF